MRDLREDNFLERLSSLRAKRGCPDNDSLAALAEGKAGRTQMVQFANHKKTCSTCRELEQRLSRSRHLEKEDGDVNVRWLAIRGSVKAEITSHIREQLGEAGSRRVAAAPVQPISTKWWQKPLVWMPAGMIAASLLAFIGFELFTSADRSENRSSASTVRPEVPNPGKTDGPDVAEVIRKDANSKSDIERLRSGSKETGDLPDSIRIELNSSILIRITAKTPQSDGSFNFDAVALESDPSSVIPAGTQLSGSASELNGQVDFTISEMRHHHVRYANHDAKHVTAKAAASDDGTYRLVAEVPSLFERPR
jgi:hypothetical protein